MSLRVIAVLGRCADCGDGRIAVRNQVPTLVLPGESDVLIEVGSARKFAAAFLGEALVRP